MIIKEVIDQAEKQNITRIILEALPEWFGIIEAREAYIKECYNQIFFAAYDKDIQVGFICLKETGKDTTEISVMGVLKDYHRKGIGRELFLKAKEAASKKGYSFLQVKTVKMGIHDEYDNTNSFYLSLGFKEFEVLPLLWDENNPCQIYIMSLK